MTIPTKIDLDDGGFVTVVAGPNGVLMVVSPNALLSRADCEHVADVLYLAGLEHEPPKSLQA